ncbi:uncharacterized protein N7496_012319 [Penicillium cataractarum]|uniref:Uncharacterized protein n=1 Tax=Penicillium cataractarum TaxID=2100454 RepID=A0A9W9URX3_9EURO|nr:uncharacterized protein N7496_012319 [Penicillium cataractarum]KAJ5355107.1 hypothetical protein N7496_012319 [Penicillium cataractarum]
MAQGSCSAMRDGITMARLVLVRRVDESILDDDEAERLAHARSLVEGSIIMWKLLSKTDPAKAAASDAFMHSGKAKAPKMPTIMSGFLQQTANGEVSLLAGTSSPQGRLCIGEREGLLDDYLGFGFPLVSNVPIEVLLASTHRDLLKSLDVRIILRGSGDQKTEDIDKPYQTYLEEHGLVAYLSRPDFCMFGTAATMDDITFPIDALATELSPTKSHRVTAKTASSTLPGSSFVRRKLPTGGFTLQYDESQPSNPMATIISVLGSAGLEMSTAKDQIVEQYRVTKLNPPG